MRKKIINIGLLICLSVIYNSCETVDFGKINDNPNGPTVAVTSQLLTGAQVSVINVVTSVRGILYTQQLTEGQYPDDSKYNTLTSNYDGWYTGPIQNLNEIIKLNTGDETKKGVSIYGDNDNQIAVARILRAYYLQYITDRWGYLPWTEAFQGINFPQPKFDSQESIYDYMFKEIDASLALIKTGAAGPAGDIILSGNMTNWKLFANTLKMTLALRVSDIKPALAKTNFEAAVSAGVIQSNADNILFSFGSNDLSDNPWEDRFESRVDYLLSVTMVESLRKKQDPRLFKYAEPSRDKTTTSTNFPGGIDAKYIGAPNGKVNGNVQDFSLPTKTVTGNQAYKTPVFTSAQVKLSLAEAKLKGWNVGTGTVSALFKKGIEESMAFWGVTKANIDKYTAQQTTATLADIAYEKWVALYLNGPEAWAEWRRLDMPVLTPSTHAATAKIPVRDAYSSSVSDNNSANYAKVLKEQGPDDLHTRLWWDIK